MGNTARKLTASAVIVAPEHLELVRSTTQQHAGTCKTCLVVDDAPGVGHHMVVVCGKGVVAGPGGAKGVAQHLHLPPAPTLQPLAHVIGCQCCQSPTQ